MAGGTQGTIFLRVELCCFCGTEIIESLLMGFSRGLRGISRCSAQHGWGLIEGLPLRDGKDAPAVNWLGVTLADESFNVRKTIDTVASGEAPLIQNCCSNSPTHEGGDRPLLSQRPDLRLHPRITS